MDQIAIQFDKKYQDNIGVQPTVRSLEVLIMKPSEGFTDYMARWRVAKFDKPKDQELILKFIYNLKEP